MNKLKQHKPLKVLSVRADEEKIKKAMALGIDLQEEFRGVLDRALLKQQNKCPVCGQKAVVKK